MIVFPLELSMMKILEKHSIMTQLEQLIQRMHHDTIMTCSQNEFKEFYKKCNIARHNITPYTHQQNGVLERIITMMTGKARSVINGVDLGQEVWVEAMNIGCHLVIRLPSQALDDTTPYEIWTCKKPFLKHIMVFGFYFYVHIPKENRAKVDNKDEQCIFIRYKYGLKGFMPCNSKTKKVLYS